MKRSKCSDEQILAIVKEGETGRKVVDVVGRKVEKWKRSAHASACAISQHACPRPQHRVTSRMPDVGCRPPVCSWSSTAVASLAPQIDGQVEEGSIRSSAPSSSSVRR
jgi:hypothetical protein